MICLRAKLKSLPELRKEKNENTFEDILVVVASPHSFDVTTAATSAATTAGTTAATSAATEAAVRAQDPIGCLGYIIN